MQINGERIRRAREDRGLTQDELSARTGVSQTVISRLECGIRSNGHFKLVATIARELGLSLDSIIKDGETNGPTNA